MVAPQKGEIGLARLVIGPVAEHLNHNVRRAENFGATAEDLGAFRGILGVRKARLDARAGFDHDFDSSLCKIGDDSGYQRHAPFPRIGFSGNTNDHEPASL